MNQHLEGPDLLSVKLTRYVEEAEALCKLLTRLGRLPEGNFRQGLIDRIVKWFNQSESDIALMIGDITSPEEDLAANTVGFVNQTNPNYKSDLNTDRTSSASGITDDDFLF